MNDSEMLAGRFALEREAGSGGMARVYLGRDSVLDRIVAVKVLRPGLAGTETAERFRREGSMAARLSHPNIVRVYDAGEAEFGGQNVSYIVMEYISGGDLKDRIRSGGILDAREVCRTGSGAASALAHAHANGVIHRDVKPHNILLDEYGEPKLTDFGIARALEGTHYTRTGNFLGTAVYSAPEQLRGAEISGETDVYSLGIALYEAATGEPPFTGTVVEVAEKHFSETPARPGTNDELADAILACLAKKPSDRPQADELAARLSALAESRPAQTTPTAVAPPLPEREESGTATMGTFRRRRSRGPLVVASLAALLIVAVASVYLLSGNAPNENGEQAASGDPAQNESQGAQNESQSGSQSGSQNVATGDGSADNSSNQSGESGSGGTGAANGSREDAVVGAVQELYDTAADEDYDRSYMLLSENFRTTIAPTREQWTGQFGTLESIRFVEAPEVEIAGNTATVSGTTIAVHSNRTERNEATWELIREDGEWKLDGLATQPAA